MEDQQRRAESLRSRGGQIAGFGAAVLALIGGNTPAILEVTEKGSRAVIGLELSAAAICLGVAVASAIWGVIRPQPFASLAADEIAIYTSDRFLTEPELWRVHLRALRALEALARHAQNDGNAAAEAIARSLYAFMFGLGFSLIALGTLIIELI